MSTNGSSGRSYKLEVWAVGLSTSGRHEEAPSIDFLDIYDSSLGAMGRMVELLKEQDEWKASIGKELKEWRGEPENSFYYENELGSLFYIVHRKMNEKSHMEH